MMRGEGEGLERERERRFFFWFHFGEVKKVRRARRTKKKELLR